MSRFISSEVCNSLSLSVCLNFNIHPRCIFLLSNYTGKIDTLFRNYFRPCLFRIWLLILRVKVWSVECSVNGWFKQPHLARVKLGEAAYLFEQPCLQVKPSPHTLRRSPPTLLCSETNWRYSKSLCSTDRALSINENGSQYKKDMLVRYTQLLHVRGRRHSLRRWLAGNRAPPSVVVTLSKTPHPHCILTSWLSPYVVDSAVSAWICAWMGECQ